MTTIEIKLTLDEEQFKKYVEFLSWLKKDQEKKQKND